MQPRDKIEIIRNDPLPKKKGVRSSVISEKLKDLNVGDSCFFPAEFTEFNRTKAYTYGYRTGKKFYVKSVYKMKINPETGLETDEYDLDSNGEKKFLGYKVWRIQDKA